MSQFLLSFARTHLTDKTDGYLALLWCMYKANQERGRYTEHIKTYLSSSADLMLQWNFQRTAVRFKKVLDAKPELNWVAPSGLSSLAFLQVKNFRGFGELSAEDRGCLLRFSKMKNIFYAPNGGGKSSLCEALEFGTTGHIKEADRRKTKLKPYVSRGGSKMSLSLMGRDKLPVIKSLAWSSCFIDRNRLQEFSLLGSKDTGSAESDVLASLIGLEEFQEVLSRFVRPESFNLSQFLRRDQAEALAQIQTDRASLIAERQQHLASIEEINRQVWVHLDLEPDQHAKTRPRFALLRKLINTKIRKAERLKLQELPAIDVLSRVERAARTAHYLLSRREKITAGLSRNAAAINYQAIYAAIQALGEAEFHYVCPACSTPLSQVVEQPYEKAQRELQALGALERLTTSRQRNDQLIVRLAVEVATSVTEIESNARKGITAVLPLLDLQKAIAQFAVASDRTEVAHQVLRQFTALMIKDTAGVAAYLDACMKKYEEIAQAGAEVKRLEEEASLLQQKVNIIRELSTDKTTYQGLIKAAGVKIGQLIVRRTALKHDDADIARFNNLIRQVEVEYGNLYRDLLGYKLFLEKERIAGIEVKAAEYYRAINDHDDDHERIDSLRFEKVSDSYRIKIQNADGSSHDAFSVLSEGHLRALGLSLLLAMAEKNKFPLIVFDDVVNAIDTDHRSNIIDLFFSDAYLKRTQMVVTTHDRLFWERFCIIAERHPQADQHSSCVLTYTNRGIVAIHHAGGFQAKVHEALNVYDIRQALIYCRVWFESIVIEYCLENAVAVTAQFGKSQLKKNNYLQVSLEKTFSLVEPHLAYDPQNFDLIKNDLLNWSGQNQEHHAFDEGSLNFVHSKTSREVIRIYDAIRLLECQLFPHKKQQTCEAFLTEVNAKITEWATRLEKLDKAPPHVREAAQQRLGLLRKRGDELTQEITYIAKCLEGISRLN